MRHVLVILALAVLAPAAKAAPGAGFGTASMLYRPVLAPAVILAQAAAPETVYIERTVVERVVERPALNPQAVPKSQGDKTLTAVGASMLLVGAGLAIYGIANPDQELTYAAEPEPHFEIDEKLPAVGFVGGGLVLLGIVILGTK